MAGSIRSFTSAEIQEHNKHIIQPPKFTWPVIRKYFATRIPSLWVGREELRQYTWHEMNLHQWNFFFLGFWAWTWDAFDFFSTSLNVSNISKDLDVSVKDVSWGITLVLMLRTVGAIIFGLLALGDAPKRARGILSGLFQEGYAFGYLLAVIFQRAIADTTKEGWRSLFWFTPEGTFREECRAKKSKFTEFRSQAKKALAQYWLIIIYLF
ncbi:Carboxylic acid transporter [Candida viswanathii]|uniref:Carboxylic acid transporter n=1 Tax=Candida viswanathii TaxID=5486 RepID=A0A367Y1G0_9ASCO|nr:Carboxylic acid transporter [Candida viswanathii]